MKSAKVKDEAQRGKFKKPDPRAGRKAGKVEFNQAMKELQEEKAAALAARPPLSLPCTVKAFAEHHQVNVATVKKWVEAGRLKSEKKGGGETRAAMILIWQTERPTPITPGVK